MSQTPKKQSAKRATAKSAKAPSKRATASQKKQVEGQTPPLMAYESTANVRTSTTSTRKNIASLIERTDKYRNIDDGLVPFRYSYQYGNSGAKSLDIRDAVILCQKAF